MKLNEFLSKQEKEQITLAIKEAELNTSGEIRLHLEKNCKEDALDKASYWFKELKMHKTKARNGVLFYLAIEDKKFAILGDVGINSVTPDDFWENIRSEILDYFKENKFTDGLSKGISMAGEALKEKFPYQKDDVNELSDEISFGKN